MNPDHRNIERIVHRSGLNRFSLHHTNVQKEDNCALYLHCHPEAEFFFLEQGTVRFSVENREFILQEGEGIFIPPDLIHHAEHEPGSSCSFFALVFSIDMLIDSLPSYCREYFDVTQLSRPDYIYPVYNREENRALLTLLSRVFSFFQQDIKTCELTLIGLLLCLWQELYNIHLLGLQKRDFATRTEIAAALEYIQQGYREQLSLTDLAAVAGLSVGHFCRSFKDFTGTTPFTYLNRFRIVKSCELLSQTDKKITDIATLCGFNNISYFNRIFLKVMGVTPSRYRRSR